MLLTHRTIYIYGKAGGIKDDSTQEVLMLLLKKNPIFFICFAGLAIYGLSMLFFVQRDDDNAEEKWIDEKPKGKKSTKGKKKAKVSSSESSDSEPVKEEKKPVKPAKKAKK